MTDSEKKNLLISLKYYFVKVSDTIIKVMGFHRCTFLHKYNSNLFCCESLGGWVGLKTYRPIRWFLLLVDVSKLIFLWIWWIIKWLNIIKNVIEEIKPNVHCKEIAKMKIYELKVRVKEKHRGRGIYIVGIGK